MGCLVCERKIYYVAEPDTKQALRTVKDKTG